MEQQVSTTIVTPTSVHDDVDVPVSQATSFISLCLSCFLLAVSGLAVIAILARFWGTNTDYSDRFVILLASGWLIWRCQGNLPRTRGNPAGFLLLIPGCLAAAPAWFLEAQVGPRSALLWWLMAAWVVTALGAVLIAGGWRWLRTLAFPLLFLLLALPIPKSIELPLQHRLKSLTTALAEFGLQASGMQVRRQGFELHLPSGGLEVVEACSGVRSITALLAIAVFVAHYRGFGLLRGLVMVGLAVPVIAIVNALRIILTGWIQETFGPEMIQGTPHEILGIVMVLVGLGLVLLLSQLLRRRHKAAADATIGPAGFARVRATPRFIPCAIVLTVGFAGSAYLYLVGDALVDRQLETAPLESMPLDVADGVGTWQGKESEIPESVREQLGYDRAILREYVNDAGYRIAVWVIYWESSTSIHGYHHPDVCFPNRGYAAAQKEGRTLQIAGGQNLPYTSRVFKRENDRKRLVFWTQEGRRVWTEEDEEKALRTGSGTNWIRDRLFVGPSNASGRLSVLMVMDDWGDGKRALELRENFTRAFAQQLYQICPWAAPNTNDNKTD